MAEYQTTQRATLPPVPPWSAPPPGNVGPPPPPAYAYAPPPAPSVPTAPTPDPEQVQREAFLATPDPVGLYVEPTGSSVPAPLVRPGRRPSARRLRWATVLALGLTMAGLGIADSLGVDIASLVYAAAALLVIGLALVLATWWGRARGLLPVGVMLTAGVLALTAASGTVAPPPEIAGSTVRYSSPVQFPAGGDTQDFGTLTVDLADLNLANDATYRANVDVGNIVVTVPPELNVRVRYRVDAGTVTVFDRHFDGTELSDTISDPQPLRPKQPTLTLDLGVDLGALEVRR